MLDLLNKYTVDEILMFLVLLALALKGTISFFDWAKGRLDKIYKKRYNIKEAREDVEKELEEQECQIQQLVNIQTQIQQQILELHKSIDMLIESDKDDIKAWLTQQHHYFCFQKGYIDDYSLDCMEKRYKHYADEGGNSFVATLMSEVRALPKMPNMISEIDLKADNK